SPGPLRRGSPYSLASHRDLPAAYAGFFGVVMKTSQGQTIISGGTLIDGNGGPPVPKGALHIVDGRITYAGPAGRAPTIAPSARQIDARGGTIMPGLVEAHFHPTYFNVAALEDLDIKYPVEYVTLL